MNAAVCSKRNMEPAIGIACAQLQRTGNPAKAVKLRSIPEHILAV
jgi:hypothetical protein